MGVQEQDGREVMGRDQGASLPALPCSAGAGPAHVSSVMSQCQVSLEGLERVRGWLLLGFRRWFSLFQARRPGFTETSTLAHHPPFLPTGGRKHRSLPGVGGRAETAAAP